MYKRQAVVAPTSGTYTIILSETNNDESSTYHASVVVGGGVLTAAADNFVDEPSGSDFTGVLEAGDLDAISVQATAGASIRAVLGFPSLEAPDPSIEILGPDGASLDSQFNTNGDGASVAVVAPTSGTYTIIFSETNNDESSTYHASVVVSPTDFIASSSNTFLNNSSPVSQTLSPGDNDLHVIGGSAGDQVTITVEEIGSSSFAPQVEVIDDSGVTVLSRGVGTHQITLTRSGNYFLRLFDLNSDQEGTYRLTVSGFTGNATVQFFREIPELAIERLPSGMLEISWEDQGGSFSLVSSENLDFTDVVVRTTQLTLGRQVLTIVPQQREFFRLER